MTGTDPLCRNMVTRSINFHGHQLLKQLTLSHPHDVQALNLQEIDYKVYKARIPEISKQSSLTQKELINFISEKSSSLFRLQAIADIKDEEEDAYDCMDRFNNQPPLEYFMKVDINIRKNIFFQNVKRGDVLYVRVCSHVHELLHMVKVQAKFGNTINDLTDTDIKAHLRVEDSEPDSADSDAVKRWLLRTRLCVEVLEVDASDEYLLVGTKGVAVPPHIKEKVKLGKTSINERPAILKDMEERTIKSYSSALERLTTFNNPRSIRHLAAKFNINIFSHMSLMGTLRQKFPDREMYKPLRKAQMARWAHKSVADGVVFFKRGQHEEAFQCLNKALQIDNENVEAFVAKGALLANLGRLEKAVENFEEALKYNPTHGNARKYICETLVELGRQHEEEKKDDEAETRYKKCLEINPDHQAGCSALASLNKKLGRAVDSNIETVQNVLRDLIEMEQDFKRKRSTSKSSPGKRGSQSDWSQSSNHTRSKSRSLSPLATKMAMQEGNWQPPSNIDTNTSYINTSNPPPVMPGYCYPPPPCWPSSSMDPNTVVAQQMYCPPTSAYPHQQTGGFVSHEDEEYKARVDKFLMGLQDSRHMEMKEPESSRSHGRESRSHKKHKGSSKKRGQDSDSSSNSSSRSRGSRSKSKRNRSRSKSKSSRRSKTSRRSRSKSKSRSKKISRSQSKSKKRSRSPSKSKKTSRSRSMSKTKSHKRSRSHSSDGKSKSKSKSKNKTSKRSKSKRKRSSSSSSSSSSSRYSSSSSSLGSESSRYSKKTKLKKKKHQSEKEKNSKVEKHKKKDVEEKPEPKSLDKQAEAVQWSELMSLDEKLSAYYKKVEESQREKPPIEHKVKEKVPSSVEREKKVKERASSTVEREMKVKGKASSSVERERIVKDKEQPPVRDGSSANPDSISQMMKVMKSYEQGFRLTSKPKVGAVVAPRIHPVFQDSDDDDDALELPASTTIFKQDIPPMDVETSYDGVVMVGDSRLRELPASLKTRVLSRGGLSLESAPSFVESSLGGEKLCNQLVVLCVGVYDLLDRFLHPECIKRNCERPLQLFLPKLDPGWEEELLKKLKRAANRLEELVCGEGSHVLITCPGPVHVSSMMEYVKKQPHPHYFPNILDRQSEVEMNGKLMLGLNYIHNELKNDKTYQNLGLSNKLTCSFFQWTSKAHDRKLGVRKAKVDIFRDGLHYTAKYMEKVSEYVQVFCSYVTGEKKRELVEVEEVKERVTEYAI